MLIIFTSPPSFAIFILLSFFSFDFKDYITISKGVLVDSHTTYVCATSSTNCVCKCVVVSIVNHETTLFSLINELSDSLTYHYCEGS